MVEPLDERMRSIEDFLHDIDPSLQYDIVPISDPFGPTKEDPTFEASGIFIDFFLFFSVLFLTILRSVLTGWAMRLTVPLLRRCVNSCSQCSVALKCVS